LRRYQRTAIAITSRGNRNPANTEDSIDDVTTPVVLRRRSINATEPLQVFAVMLGQLLVSCQYE